MPKRSFRIALVAVLATLVLLAVVAGWFVHRALAYPDEPHAGKGVEVEVEVLPGMSFPRIALLMTDKGIVDKPTWFRLYAMSRGVTGDVKSGRYVLRDDQTPRQILDALIVGVRDKTVKVTLPEGKNMLEYFALIEQAGIAKASELEALARSPQFLQQHGIPGDSADGYLFPETYEFRVGEKPARVLARLIGQHQRIWNDVMTRNTKTAQKLKQRLSWTDRDVLVMASIVEKEAVAASEQPRIAQVFINRLTSPSFKPKKLETDPTIRYGCMVPLQKSAACKSWDPAGRLFSAQLQDKDNPYNTYQHEGLPPGPISNPGRGAIEATVNPDGSNYFYFVSRNDGTHVFSRTLSEHEKYVDKYQR
jgi:UPF0755 protein